MDLLYPALITLLFSLLPLAIFVIFHRSKKPRTCSLPQAGGAWPIIGHMHLFWGNQLMYQTLSALADKYGPVFGIKLGVNKVLVLSSWEMVKECFTIHDKAFSDRPRVTSSTLLTYDHAMFAFAPYGSYWREIRKIATVELLSNHRIDLLKHIRDVEVESAINELYKTSGAVVDMKQWFGHLASNITLRMVGGKRCFGPNADVEEGAARRFQKMMRDYVHFLGMVVLSDAIPWLGWLDFQGHEKLMKRTAKELDAVLGGWLEEHKQERLLDGKEKKEQDFMDVMLNIVGEAKLSGYDADTIVKATCLNLIIGGSDTTMVILIWALSLLLNNPHVLHKAQEELDSLVGRNRHVDETNINNLVYLQAIVKETLRLYPPGPIIGHRSTLEDCTLSTGYHIPSGTRVMVNLHKVHRDERVWPNPHEFQPERFLTTHKNVDVRGQSFELIPFGSGRRACPGINLGLKVVHLALASVLHGFEVVKPTNKAVDMSESSGLSYIKATPLEAVLTPRLDSSLYADQRS